MLMDEFHSVTLCLSSNVSRAPDFGDLTHSSLVQPHRLQLSETYPFKGMNETYCKSELLLKFTSDTIISSFSPTSLPIYHYYSASICCSFPSTLLHIFCKSETDSHYKS